MKSLNILFETIKISLLFDSIIIINVKRNI